MSIKASPTTHHVAQVAAHHGQRHVLHQSRATQLACGMRVRRGSLCNLIVSPAVQTCNVPNAISSSTQCTQHMLMGTSYQQRDTWP